MKKLVSFVFFWAVNLFFVKIAFAQEMFEDSPSVLEIAANVVAFIFTILGIMGATGFALGGLMYIISSGNPERMENAKRYLGYCIWGVVLAVGSLIIVITLKSFISGTDVL